jgi:CRP-like cAMP-binding protein
VRIESSVTSVSWIPREAIEGMVKLPFELGVAHYDLPPPDRLDDLEGLLGDELFLLFDGVLAVEHDGRQVVEVGPGAILGEMALLEGGRRTATLRAVTRCRVAVVPGDRVDRTALAEVARRRRNG